MSESFSWLLKSSYHVQQNKKQRMIVRAAVIKGKDPHQIMADLDRLDQMGKLSYFGNSCSLKANCSLFSDRSNEPKRI